MAHDPADAIHVATRVLDAIYDRKPEAIEPLVAILRSFAEGDRERAMPPDELACTVIERELVRIKQTSKTRAAGG